MLIRDPKTLSPGGELSFEKSEAKAKKMIEDASECEKSGKHREAISLTTEAISILEREFGSVSLHVALALEELWLLYRNEEDFANCLSTALRVVSIYEEKLGLEHEYLSAALGNVSVTYKLTGDSYKALEFDKRAVKIRQKVFGSENLKTAISLFNLANTYVYLGEYAEAEPLQRQVVSVQKRILGLNDRYTLDSCIQLGRIWAHTMSLDQAIHFQEDTLKLAEKKFGNDDSIVGRACLWLGLSYRLNGNYTQALQNFQKAFMIRKRLDKPNSSEVLRCQVQLAETHYINDDDYSQAREIISNVYSIREESLQKSLLLTERGRLSWQRENVSYNLIELLEPDQIARFILRTKGIVLDSLLEDQASLKQLGESTEEVMEVKTDRLRIGKLAFSDKKGDQEEIERLRTKIDSVMVNAAGKRAKLGRVRAAVTVNPDTVATSLSTGDALVEFIQFDNPKIKGDEGRCYGCLILGQDGKSRFLRIDNAKAIDSAVLAVREAIDNGDEKSLAEQQRILSQMLWAPVSQNLPDGTRRLFIGTDGQLSFLSFAALPAPDGRFLAEHYHIAYVGSGRDLARDVSATVSKKAAIFADPVFDRQSSVFSTNALALRSSEVHAFNKITLPPLLGTRNEGLVIETTLNAFGWSPEVCLGEAASKSAVVELKSPGILHLATHGFYLNTPSYNGGTSEANRGMKVTEANKLLSMESELPKIDPMRASGIALTGAQATFKAWSEGRVPDPKSDGILSAEEVGALDLNGTWIVTLSACETGIGEARTGEGVFGLRRAFMIAGAQNLLMTLWKVGDEITPSIMADFYKEALETHDAAESLAKVQRDWLVKLRKEKGLLVAVRDAGPFAMAVMTTPTKGGFVAK